MLSKLLIDPSLEMFSPQESFLGFCTCLISLSEAYPSSVIHHFNYRWIPSVQELFASSPPEAIPPPFSVLYSLRLCIILVDHPQNLENGCCSGLG